MEPSPLIRPRRERLPLSLLCWLLWTMAPPAGADGSAGAPSSYLAVYAGQLSADPLFETLTLRAQLDSDFPLRGLAVGHTLARYTRQRSLAIELQYAQHTGVQGYDEYVVVAIYRWAGFAWDESLRTTFAVGEGLSYITEDSQLEALRHTETARFLNYLLFEVTLAPPTVRDWRFLVRVHHRSGVYGLFSGVHGASNAIVMGLRHDF